jgi:VanZ family protein
VRKKINAVLTLAVISVIAFYSMKPGSAVDPSTGGMFPILHLLAYFGLAGSFLLHLHNRENGYLLAVFSAFVFGLSMEVAQTQIPGRFFTYKDLMINLVGASVTLVDTRIRFTESFIQMEDRLIERSGNWQSI